MTVYVDLLFIVNWMINTLVLAGAVALAGEKPHRLRLPAAAALGAMYCVLMFFPEADVLLWLGMRVLVGAVMVYIGIPTPNLRRYLRALMMFYISLAVFGGGMYLFYTFTAAGAEMLYSNGVFYIDLPLWLLLGLSFAFYGLIRLGALLQYKKHPPEGRVELEICLNGSYRTVTALLDTGNTLVDPLTLAPVIVVEAKALAGLLPDELLRAVERGITTRPEVLSHCKCRLLPYRSVGGEERLLPVIRPTFVRLLPSGSAQEHVLLGLTGTTLSETGEYHALLHHRMK